MITLSYPCWWRGWGIAANACIAAWRSKGAASLQASYVNLANPGTNDATLGVAPAWTAANGWSFSGTEYLDTGIPPNGLSTALARFSGRYSASSCVFGGRAVGTGSPAGFGLLPRAPSQNWYYDFGTRSSNSGPTRESGVIGIAGTRTFADGVKLSDTLQGSSLLTNSIYIGSYHTGTGRDSAWYGNIEAIVVYNAILTDAQMAAVTLAMNRL